jgi:hypothetical protein
MTKQTPDEMERPIQRFKTYLREETDLLLLVASALGVASKQQPLAEALYEYEILTAGQDQLESLAAHRDRQIAFAEAARKEVERGFPRLCAHTAVAIWGALEVLIEDTLVAALITDLDKADATRLDRIRLPFGQFERVDRVERLRAAVGQLLQDESSRGGITRFENALAVVSLSGPLDDVYSRSLWELQNVRNVIVHNASIADQRLVTGCPWLGIRRGDDVVITIDQVLGYGTAAARYGLALRARIAETYGLNIDPQQKPTETETR